MKNYIFLFLIILIPITFKIILELTKKDNKLPYTKKKYFLTPTEQKFYLMLSEWFGTEYYIFPQIHLSSIIDIDESEKKNYKYLNKIDRKSIDFVLFDKINMLPVLAVELDDYTHGFNKRQKRDQFVNTVFKAANMSIIHITNANDLNNKALIESLIIPAESVYNNIS